MAIALLAIGAAPVGAARWSKPARLSSTVSLDATPVQVAFAPGGAAAVAFGFVDPDAPGGGRASVALLSASGRPSRVRAVPHTRQVLDLAYLGGTWQLLGGTSGGGLGCCTQIQTLTLGMGGFTGPRTLIRTLRGVATGSLVASGSGSLVVFGSDSGVWTARAARDARFGAVRRLTPAAQSPQSLVTTVLHGGGSLVMYAQAPLAGGATPPPPTIMRSRGRAGALPGPPQAVGVLSAGTVIGPLALAPDPFSPTVGWTQDSADASGANTSSVVLAAAGPALHPHSYSVPGEIESMLDGAASGSGDQLYAWDSCDTTPVCHVLAVSRPAHGHFGTARTLGIVDAAAQPAVAVGAHGGAVIAWVQGGRIFYTRRSSATQRFSAPARLSAPGPVSGLRLSAGPGGRVLAVWAAGTTRTTIWSSLLR